MLSEHAHQSQGGYAKPPKTYSCADLPPPTTSATPGSGSVIGFTAESTSSMYRRNSNEWTTGPGNPLSRAFSGVSSGGLYGSLHPFMCVVY